MSVCAEIAASMLLVEWCRKCLERLESQDRQLWGLFVEVRGRSLEHNVILTPLSVTSCVSLVSTPLSVSLSTSSNGPALPYSAHTSRTYVSGDKASWGASNVVLGRLWDEDTGHQPEDFKTGRRCLIAHTSLQCVVQHHVRRREQVTE